MFSKFSDKIVLITGAGSGIGRAAALAFSEHGAKVVISDISANAGEETLKTMKKLGGHGIFIQADVSSADQVSSLIKKTVDAYGRLDCAFNNAATEGPLASTVNLSEENWNQVLAVNLKGTWLSMKYEIPQMLKQGGGVIINASSLAGLVGFRELPAYTASKHGIIGLTKSAALEYARFGIRINAVCPGLIDTPMFQRQTKGNAKVIAQITNFEPMGRLGKPEEVAKTIVWLCSDEASFMTGHALPVDGGWVTQ